MNEWQILLQQAQRYCPELRISELEDGDYPSRWQVERSSPYRVESLVFRDYRALEAFLQGIVYCADYIPNRCTECDSPIWLPAESAADSAPDPSSRLTHGREYKAGTVFEYPEDSGVEHFACLECEKDEPKHRAMRAKIDEWQS